MGDGRLAAPTSAPRVQFLRDLSLARKLTLTLLLASVATLTLARLGEALPIASVALRGLVSGAAIAVLISGLSRALDASLSASFFRMARSAREPSGAKEAELKVRRGDGSGLTALAVAVNELLRNLRATQEELSHLRASFEQEVVLRTRELTERNEELQASMEEARAAAMTKAQFLANMSHEIRTPMNGVLGMNELLLDSPLNEQQRSYAEIVKSSAESLLEIINDILDFSKIEAGKLRLEEIEFELHRTVEEVIELLSGSARKKGLELFCWIAPALPHAVRGDPTRLRQVLTNLVGNAIKFTEQGKISVRVEPFEEREGAVAVRFFIEDTGIGISKDRQKRLFLPFSQGDSSTTRRYGGTGLGLAISKQLVELMGGEIGVTSELGVGSTFWFSVQLEEIPAGRSKGFVLPDGVQRPRVLVADNSTAAREMLHQQLLAWGFEHEVTADSSRALAAIRRGILAGKPFALCLLDAELCASERDELVLFLREEKAVPRPKVVLLAWAGAELPELSESLESIALLSKPVRPSELFDAIMGLVGEGDLIELSTEETPGGAGAAEGGLELGPRLSILLAEDNPINQLVASKILAKGGYRCDVVSDGQQAIEAVARGDHDVVFMDCQMPEVDGFEAARAIRRREAQDPGRTRVFLIALTANAMKGDRERCLEAGMDDYLSKPVKPELLLHKLRDFSQANAERLERKYGGERASAPQEEEPFDVGLLLQRYAGRTEELRAAIHDLDRRSIDCLGRLKYCLGVKSAEEARDLTQDLRSALALFSSERLHQLAVRLEELSGERRFAEAVSCFGELQRELARCRAWLPEVMARAEYP